MIILSASLEYRNANRKRINFYFNNESGDKFYSEV